MATKWTLLHSTGRLGHALYEDGKLVAHFDRSDTVRYIDRQILYRAGTDAEVVERDHVGEFPETLPAAKPKAKPKAAQGELEV